jgi:hypothetical protein
MTLYPPHHGPIKLECPIECLLTVMSRNAFNPLERALPRTVGDVAGMYARRQLGEIRNLGPRRISEIEAALVLAGFDLAGLAHGVGKASSPEPESPATINGSHHEE